MTNPRIISVQPQENYLLLLHFDNEEWRIFDVKPFLSKGIFKALQDKAVFARVKPILGSIQWSNGADFCPDMLYLDSSPTTALIHDSMKNIRANIQELA
jgi:hypothetical protein